MKPRIFALFLAVFPLAALSASGQTSTPPPPKSALFDLIMKPFGGMKSKPNEKETEVKGPQYKHMALSMAIEPKTLKLSETRQFKVTLTLVNRSKQLAQLEFPTSQRIEVIVKTKAGKLVEQWSEDQAFINEPSLVALNPGERAEYVANLATRDMAAGETYVVEAFFPNIEPLKIDQSITPVK